MTEFFARTISGVEKIAWIDIQNQFPSAKLKQLSKRLIRFTCKEPPHKLLAIASIDDIFVFVGTTNNLDRKRTSLETIGAGTRSLNFQDAILTLRHVRKIPKKIVYRITANVLGKRNYSRHDVANAISVNLSKKLNWVYQDDKRDTLKYPVDIRVIIEDSSCLIGLRLGHAPLHRRAYKLNSRPGSLHPPLAYGLTMLAGLDTARVVLDPMCGAGTIPIESSQTEKSQVILGADAKLDSASSTYHNAASIGDRIQPLLWVGDARNLPLCDQSVDRLICNLPWGRQVETTTPLHLVYQASLHEFSRILIPDLGKMVLLTSEPAILLKAAHTHTPYRLCFANQVSLFGQHPTIMVFAHQNFLPPALQPFGNRLDAIAKASLFAALSHKASSIRLWALEFVRHLTQEVAFKKQLKQMSKTEEDPALRRKASDILAFQRRNRKK